MFTINVGVESFDCQDFSEFEELNIPYDVIDEITIDDYIVINFMYQSHDFDQQELIGWIDYELATGDIYILAALEDDLDNIIQAYKYMEEGNYVTYKDTNELIEHWCEMHNVSDYVSYYLDTERILTDYEYIEADDGTIVEVLH